MASRSSTAPLPPRFAGLTAPGQPILKGEETGHMGQKVLCRLPRESIRGPAPGSPLRTSVGKLGQCSAHGLESSGHCCLPEAGWQEQSESTVLPPLGHLPLPTSGAHRLMSAAELQASGIGAPIKHITVFSLPFWRVVEVKVLWKSPMDSRPWDPLHPKRGCRAKHPSA